MEEKSHRKQAAGGQADFMWTAGTGWLVRTPLGSREGPLLQGGPWRNEEPWPALLGDSTGAAGPSLMGHQEFYSWFYGFVLS